MAPQGEKVYSDKGPHPSGRHTPRVLGKQTETPHFQLCRLLLSSQLAAAHLLQPSHNDSSTQRHSVLQQQLCHLPEMAAQDDLAALLPRYLIIIAHSVQDPRAMATDLSPF